MIETPNLHKAVPGPYDMCVTCNRPVMHLPAGQGWVHEDGHVLGYNATPTACATVCGDFVPAEHDPGHCATCGQYDSDHVVTS